MSNVNIKINGADHSAPAGSTILEAAKLANIHIPTLCYLKEVNEIGACRMCIVEVKGKKNLVTSCVYPIEEGMEIFTDTPKVKESRRKTLKLLISDHDKKCISCVRSTSCDLQTLCKNYDVTEEDYYNRGRKNHYDIDKSATHMERDNNKCILCRRCSAVCEKVQGVAVIGPNERGFNTYLGTAFDMGVGNTNCVSCGQCIVVCPVGALYEKDNTDEVFAAIADPKKFVIAQAAPSVSAALGEAFEFPVGINVRGRLVTALRELGFDKVCNTNFATDITIVENGKEIKERIQGIGVLPMMMSYCPGWIKYCENYYPDFLENQSPCKSPQEKYGEILKSYYADKMGIKKKNIVVVSVTPCTASKSEVQRKKQFGTVLPDVDIAITSNELARMLKEKEIQLEALQHEDFDEPISYDSHSDAIFGVCGSVIDASLCSVSEKLTDYKDVNGVEGIKEASYEISGKIFKAAFVSGLENARNLLDKVKSGELQYQFIEVMACPEGCVNAGGHPHQLGEEHAKFNIFDARMNALRE